MLMAAFRLAFHFNRPVSELNIGWNEFRHWLAYLEINDPEEPDNRRLAILMAQMTNMSGKSLAKGKTVKPDDFLPKKKQKSSDQKAFFMSLRRSDG